VRLFRFGGVSRATGSTGAEYDGVSELPFDRPAPAACEAVGVATSSSEGGGLDVGSLGCADGGSFGSGTAVVC